MKLFIPEKSNFTPAPAGLHNAVCTAVIDLGIQATVHGNKDQVLILWELVNSLMNNGQPFIVNHRFSKSLFPKSALRRTLESWRGRAFTKEELAEFELRMILGKPCKIMVQHAPSLDGSRVYANVVSVTPIDKGVAVTPMAEPLYFDMETPDLAIKAKLPQWIRERIDAAVPLQNKVPASHAAEPNTGINYELFSRESGANASGLTYSTEGRP